MPGTPRTIFLARSRRIFPFGSRQQLHIPNSQGHLRNIAQASFGRTGTAMILGWPNRIFAALKNERVLAPVSEPLRTHT